jgi:predicted nucleic acid-binding protein
MPKVKKLIYWDSDCFLAILKDNEPEKTKLCRSVLREAEAGKVLIVTSSIAFIEVIKTKAKVNVEPAAEKKIQAFFEHSYISVRNVTPAVGRKARELIWKYGLRPRDSIHIATALLDNIPVLHAFDEDLLKLNGRFPGLSICQPKIEQYEIIFPEPNEKPEENTKEIKQ